MKRDVRCKLVVCKKRNENELLRAYVFTRMKCRCNVRVVPDPNFKKRSLIFAMATTSKSKVNRLRKIDWKSLARSSQDSVSM